MGPSPDRRRLPRTPTQVECKLLRPFAPRYVEAVTVDISSSGVLLLVEAGSPLRVGEEVELVIAWDGAPLITAEDTLAGVVVRAGGSDLRLQPAAIEFDATPARLAGGF